MQQLQLKSKSYHTLIMTGLKENLNKTFLPIIWSKRKFLWKSTIFKVFFCVLGYVYGAYECEG